MLQRFFAGCSVAALFVAAQPAQAGWRPAQIAISEIQPAGAVCGFGYVADPSGICVDTLDRRRMCAPPYVATSAPNGNGYWCMPVEWLNGRGTLMNFLGVR